MTGAVNIVNAFGLVCFSRSFFTLVGVVLHPDFILWLEVADILMVFLEFKVVFPGCQLLGYGKYGVPLVTRNDT